MKQMKTKRFGTTIIAVCILLIGGCSRANHSHQESPDPFPLEHETVISAKSKLPSPLRDANRVGVQFKFEVERQRFVEGEPIVVTVHAINTTERDVQLRPKSLYPSLFDFGIWDNNQPLQYSVNMAINTGNKTVTIPVNSRVLWTKEDIVANTMGFGGKRSSLRIPGPHKVMFGFGENQHVIELVIEELEKMPNKPDAPDRK